MFKKIEHTATCLFIFMIDIYRKYISGLKPPSCRFIPTCSQYSKEALLKYGLFKGFYLSARRILRCHPFSKGGYDPLV